MERLEWLFFGALSAGLSMLSKAGPGQTIGVVVGLLCSAYFCAYWHQRRLNQWLSRNPLERAPVGRMEASCSLFFPVAFLFFGMEGAARGIRNWLQGARKGAPANLAGGKNNSKSPLRVATLGPSFFLAGLVSASIYWIFRLAEPALASFWGLSPGHSLGEAILLGSRRELAWLLPLSDRPTVALVLILCFWLVIWWSFGNLLRGLWFKGKLQQNYGTAGQKELADILTVWRVGFGVLDLATPSFSYRRWGAWLVAVCIVLLGLASATIGAERAAVAPGDFAIASILILSWILHLRLRGKVVEAPGATDSTDEPAPAHLSGWSQVLEQLDRQFSSPAPEIRFERIVPPRNFEHPPSDIPTLSPLLCDLCPYDQDPGERSELLLNRMQATVLRDLSRLGFVHLPEPHTGDSLRLSAGGLADPEQPEHLKARHQVVLAPEGAGKTTLGILAAANCCLVHSRATLWVTRSESQAEVLTQRIQAMVQPSTLRWNLRLRRVGRDFASDLSRDIIPDLVVVSVRQLVTRLLDNNEVYTPFLSQVGLVIVEDVESLAGAVEIHAHLAFSRLQMLFRSLFSVEHFGQSNSPLMLILGSSSMHQTGVWARGLCGVQAGVRTFGASKLASGDESPNEEQRQIGFRLTDLRTSSGRRLSVQELVAVCEAVGAPWHYRPCGDGRRHRGRGPLFLQQEPESYRQRADDATVLILEGRWSEVRRELARLPFAGLQTEATEVAFIIDISKEEEAAGSALDPNLGCDPSTHMHEANDLARRLASLPLPILRPPSTLVIQNHLVSDLLQKWVEVGDLVDTFEAPIAGCLRHLREQNMLYTEERQDVNPELKRFESRVYVRAAAGSIKSGNVQPSDDGIEEQGLYDKVRQVELVSATAVAVRNRVDHRELRRVEGDSAGLRFYPGRVFEDSRGRFAVVGRSSSKGQAGAIQVEPLLRDDISSPRHQIEMSAAPALELTFQLFEPELVLLGRDPVAIGLQAVRAMMTTTATYRLDRISGLTRSRELHSRETQERFQPMPLDTVALVLIPNPGTLLESAPRLRLGEARLLAALLRFLLPLIYRDIRDQLEIALSHVVDDNVLDERVEDRESAEVDPGKVVLGPEDAFFLFDLHRGGNGIARALYREGLDLPLRLCRHFLRYIEDLDQFRRFFDHSGGQSEVIEDGRTEQPGGSVADIAPHSSPKSGFVSKPIESQKEAIVDSAGDRAVAGVASEDALVDPADGGTQDQRLQLWEGYRQGLQSWLDSRLLAESVVDKAIEAQKENAKGAEDGGVVTDDADASVEEQEDRL